MDINPIKWQVLIHTKVKACGIIDEGLEGHLKAHIWHHGHYGADDPAVVSPMHYIQAGSGVNECTNTWTLLRPLFDVVDQVNRVY